MRKGQGGKFTPPAQNLTVEQTDCTLGAVEERTATVSFTAPAEWTLAVVYDNAETDADEWLSVSSENGTAGEQTVELVARMNFGDTDRTARVEITCGEQTAQVTVTQSISNETDFTDLFDPDFAKKLEEQEIIPNAQKITRQDMAKIAAVTKLDVSKASLTSLQGIAYFESLTTLDCYWDELTSLDVSKNTALTYLDCGDNSLTSLDVSKNTALTELFCYENQLTALDISQNTALAYLWCENNPGDGESTFPLTVWDDFDPNNIPFYLSTEVWPYENKIIIIQYKKAE